MRGNEGSPDDTHTWHCARLPSCGFTAARCGTPKTENGGSVVTVTTAELRLIRWVMERVSGAPGCSSVGAGVTGTSNAGLCTHCWGKGDRGVFEIFLISLFLMSFWFAAGRRHAAVRDLTTRGRAVFVVCGADTGAVLWIAVVCSLFLASCPHPLVIAWWGVALKKQ